MGFQGSWEQHCDKGCVDGAWGHLRTETSCPYAAHRLPDKPALCGTPLTAKSELHNLCCQCGQTSSICLPNLKKKRFTHISVCEGNCGDVQAFISSSMRVIYVNTSPASTNKSSVCYCSRTYMPLNLFPYLVCLKQPDTDISPTRSGYPIHLLCSTLPVLAHLMIFTLLLHYIHDNMLLKWPINILDV